MSITIRPVESRADTKRFIKMVWKIYTGDPHWVPPLIFDRMRILNTKKNPFYHHAQMQLFLAEKNGEIVGRIAAIVNENHNKIHQDHVGFFGFFESMNDQAIAKALFDAAAQWLRSKGMDTMRGPHNPSVNDEIGLLVDGFDSSPVIMMTYNPQYYVPMIESYGFQKAKDLYAFLLKRETTISDKLQRVQAAVREREQVTVRNIDLKNLQEEIKIIKVLYNRAWEKNWGAVAMTDAEFDFLAADMKQVLGPFPEFAMVAERKGEPVGFSLTLPDINQVLKKNKNGWLIPGAIRLLIGKNKIDMGRILVLGIIPEFRKRGIDAVMYYEIWERAAKRGIYRGEAGWVLEDNVMMNRTAALLNGERYKTYRIYDYVL